jgi:hypothetical protein
MRIAFFHSGPQRAEAGVPGAAEYYDSLHLHVELTMCVIVENHAIISACSPIL